jgi:hypothetical protein
MAQGGSPGRYCRLNARKMADPGPRRELKKRLKALDNFPVISHNAVADWQMWCKTKRIRLGFRSELGQTL